MKAGRPIRFLAVALTGWAAGRTILLWPIAARLAVPEALPPATTAGAVAAMLAIAPGLPGPRPAAKPSRVPAVVVVATAPLVTVASEPRSIAPREERDPVATPAMPLTVSPPHARADPRLSASAWLIARGGTRGALPGGQLGASQTGVRIAYAIDDAHRLAIAGRVSAPLAGGGREAALGVDWRLTTGLHVIAEYRAALDGGDGGPALSLVGGVGPTAIAGGMTLEAYAQAGAVFRGPTDRFADGAARITREIRGGGDGRVRLDMGVGAWGGAQRGAARVDLGPTLGAALPIGRRGLRLTLDWRQRIAGDATPGSGPALAIGSDF